MYLGVDGGGTKTAFLLLNDKGQVAATYTGGSSYYPEVTMEGVGEVIREGVEAVMAKAKISVETITYAFFGLPAYGEDSIEDSRLEILPSTVLNLSQYTCGNDMVCSWAGSLACVDGISVVAGTGSIGYGEYLGLNARAGGWGDLFGDEGSAYWIAREGLTAFSRMSDGRSPKGALYPLFMQHFKLRDAIDLAGKINNLPAKERSTVAQISKLVTAAALAGDNEAIIIYKRAADELAELVTAIRQTLKVPRDLKLPVSYTGGVFNTGKLILEPFRAALAHANLASDLKAPLLEPAVGAALYAARCKGIRFSDEVIHEMRETKPAGVLGFNESSPAKSL